MVLQGHQNSVEHDAQVDEEVEENIRHHEINQVPGAPQELLHVVVAGRLNALRTATRGVALLGASAKGLWTARRCAQNIANKNTSFLYSATLHRKLTH